jgi:hypothetical protein
MEKNASLSRRTVFRSATPASGLFLGSPLITTFSELIQKEDLKINYTDLASLTPVISRLFNE